MSGRRLVVLLVLAAIGAAVYGLPGALVGYVVGMVVSALIPDPGASCKVPQRAPDDEPGPASGQEAD